MPTRHIVKLDFTEHDTIGLLEMLIAMCNKGEVSGLIYAVGLRKPKGKNAVYCGTTGRLADDPIAAAGLAAMLATKLSHDAIETSINNRT